MEINPIFPDIWFNLGMIYMTQNNFEKALNSFSKNLSMNDSNCEVWGNLGVCFIQLKKYKQAIARTEAKIAQLKKAQQINKQNKEPQR